MNIVIATILYLLIGFFVNANGAINETYSLVGIILLSLVMTFDITQKTSGIITRIILIGIVIRLTVLYLDYGQVASILHSGADSEVFYKIALANCQNPGSEPFYLTNYTVFLTYLFKLIGSQRLFAQFINVILGVYTILMADKCLSLFNCSRKRRIHSALLLSFLPNLVIFSSILLRESIIIFFTIWSFYLFLRWIKFWERKSFIYSLMTLTPAVLMHSGMIGIAIGYLLVYSIYDSRSGCIILGYKAWISLILSITVVAYLFLFTDILGYFSGVIDSTTGTVSTEALIEKQNLNDGGGSRYLDWLTIGSLPQLLLYSPLKILYFLFSPIPPDIRGMKDIVAFLIDSVFYILVLFLIYNKGRKKSFGTYPIERKTIHLLMTPIWIVIILYSFGTRTAGTAMRHRANVFPELVVLSMLSIPNRKSDSLKIERLSAGGGENK